MGKTQLHQILAVEAAVNAKATKLLTDGIHAFTRKAQHFTGQYRRYTKLNDDGISYPHEDKHVATTVKKELSFIKQSLIDAMDVSFQKEATNAIAKADLVVNKEVIAANLPVTFLLNLETKLNIIKKTLESIPTLDNGVEWTPSENDKNISETKPVQTFKTSKVEDFRVIVEPTQFHKAHVEKVTKDTNVGIWEVIKRSGEYSTEDKSKLLSKIDGLLVAVKKARAKANQQEILSEKIGSQIINYIFS